MSNHLYKYATALSIAACAGLGCSGGAPEPQSQSEVAVTFDALRAAVAECGAALGSCSRDAAGDGAALQACRDTFTGCVEPALPDPPAGSGGDDDAGSDHEPPVAACIDALLACVMADGDARVCAEDVRACIIASVPAPPGVIPDDPGSQAGDAGMPDDLPEPPVPDAGAPGDVPPPVLDAGMADAPTASACMEAFDACVAAGGTRQSCAQQQKQCGRP